MIKIDTKRTRELAAQAGLKPRRGGKWFGYTSEIYTFAELVLAEHAKDLRRPEEAVPPPPAPPPMRVVSEYAPRPIPKFLLKLLGQK